MSNGISRRTVLAGTGVVGLAAAMNGLWADWAAAAPPLTDAELEAMRQRWVDLITGRTMVDPGSEVFAAPLAELDQEVEDFLAQLDTSPDRDRIFLDRPLDTSGGVDGTHGRLTKIATAWATPGSAHHQDDDLVGVVTAGLRDANRLVYHEGQPEFGNWWSWEIGASRALADAMAIMYEHIDAADLAAYCAAIDHFVPDPYLQFMPPRERVVSTGANRVDLCQAVIIRSIVGADVPRLQHAVAGLSDTWQYVTTGDGFFRDGSFVQHSTIGYTGTYGVVLLGGLSKLFALVAGTGHDINDPTRVILDESVEASYAPVIWRGQMMDAVRGRAISREGSPSHVDGDAAIEAILRLTGAVDDELGDRWRGLCRQWIEAPRTEGVHDILDGASVVRTAMVHDLLSSDIEPRPDAGGPRLFPGMDRLVHRGADNRWALTVAMCSNRISWYECGNGENDLGYQTSSGMTYLYLDDQGEHFDDQFWPTSDLTAPPGTTVDTVPLPPRVEGQWGSGLPDNEWTGGATLAEWSLAGQHLIGPGSTGLHARKTWLAGEDVIICLGSDITTAPDVDRTTVVAAHDAHVNDGKHADTNFGTAATLLIKGIASAGSDYHRQTFLAFDPAPTATDDATITLDIAARVADSNGTESWLDVYLAEDFDEATVTWRTKPAIGERLGRVEVSGPFAQRTLDLSDSLRDKVSAGERIVLALVQDLPDGVNAGLSVEVRSRETNAAPVLTVAVPQPTGRTKSVVEHRNLGTDGGRLLLDGDEVSAPVTVTDPTWAHLDGTAGYVFLEPGQINASVATRSGSWSRIHGSGSETVHERSYATIEVQHPAGGEAGYAYLVLPQADEATTRARADEPGVKVLANTATAQGVVVGDLTAANFWQPGTVGPITADKPACVMFRRDRENAWVSVSDPTQQAATVTVQLQGGVYARVDGEGVSMSRSGRATVLEVDVADRGGVPVEVQLLRS
ncbi:polysaccharide lyase family 8 super-sandwich domain-containing protein [Propionibacteriaceae bacterium Y2011]